MLQYRTQYQGASLTEAFHRAVGHPENVIHRRAVLKTFRTSSKARSYKSAELLILKTPLAFEVYPLYLPVYR